MQSTADSSINLPPVSAFHTNEDDINLQTIPV